MERRLIRRDEKVALDLVALAHGAVKSARPMVS